MTKKDVRIKVSVVTVPYSYQKGPAKVGRYTESRDELECARAARASVPRRCDSMRESEMRA